MATLICLGIVLIATVVFVTCKNQYTAQQYQAEGQKYSLPSAIPPAHGSDSQKQTQNGDSKPACWQILLAWPGGITTWAILLTLFVISWQSWETAKAATAQMDADRAWVIASIHGQPKEPLTGSVIHGYMPGIVWQIHIAGNTPARIIRERYRCRIVPAADGVWPPKPQLEPIPVYLSRTPSIEGEIVFAPDHKYLTSIPLEPEYCTAEHLALVVMNTEALCAYGCIEYEDAFKRKGITQFCAVYQRFNAVIQSPDGTDLNPPGFRIGGPPGYNYNK